jgi:hypothetical protein
MPFDPSSDDAWWPNPWPPRNGPIGGTPYPNDWTDPFINPRASALNPVASAPAPFSAAQLGAMAWHPPIFPGDWPKFVPNNFTAAAWPPQPVAPTLGIDLTTTPGWPYPQSILAQLAQFATPAAAPAIDTSRGLFSRDPSIPIGGGLFPYPLGSDPDPTSPFSSRFVSTGGGAASSRTLGMPDTSSAPVWPGSPSWPAPFAPLQDPFAAGGPALDSTNSPFSGPPDGSAAPPSPGRSVLFNPPRPALDFASLLLEHERDAATLDSIAQELGPSDLPLSKSGAPFVSPPPQFSITPQFLSEPPQWLDVARLLSPNLVDYFTKTLPPAPPFPATPGKIPSTDNPYAPGAAFEAATWLLAGLERGIVGPVEGVAGSNAAATVPKIAREAAFDPLVAPILDRAALLRLNGQLGQLGEEAVGIPANAPKASIKISESGLTRYPDRLTGTTIEEVKNVKYLAFTQQLRDYLAHAENNDLTFILHARPETTYSGPLQQLIDAGQIKLRYIPRPSK